MQKSGGSPNSFNTSGKFLPVHWHSLPFLSTNQVAAILCVSPQTVRTWACYDSGPFKVRPVKPYGRLLWCTKELIRITEYSNPSIQ